MQVATLTMDPRIARIHYYDYRKKCGEHRDERRKELERKGKEAGTELGKIRIAKSLLEREDEQLLLAYKALLKGQRLLDIQKTILNAGLDDSHFPKLAICQANREKCWCHFDGGKIWFTHEHYLSYRNVKNNASTIRMSGTGDYFNRWWRQQRNISIEASALVPAVPAHLRPKNLADYFILWEAEWTRTAPGDPILLKRVNNAMFAVVAQWDLSPLEKMVLEGRFSD